MTTYRLAYDGDLVAVVEIDHTKADPFIKEMVEFWSSSGDRLACAKGDYTVAWLHQLAAFLWHYDRAPDGGPHGDEGWYPLGGSYGIKLTAYCPYEWDEGLIEVEEKREAKTFNPHADTDTLGEKHDWKL